MSETGLAENPTIRDVARLAGVSAGTVSRAINGKIRRTEDTYQRVMQAVRRTGYRKKRRVAVTGTIACISKRPETILVDREGTLDPMVHTLQTGIAIQEAASACEFQTVSLHAWEGNSIDSVMKQLDVRGVVYITPDCDRDLMLPSVVVNQYLDSGTCTSVDCDDWIGLCESLALLKDLGHRRIAFFSDTPIHASQHPRQHRIPNAIHALGLDWDPTLVRDRSFPFGDEKKFVGEAVDHYLKLPDRPTAIVLSSDVYAPIFYDLLRQAGLEVPRDISLVGFDDYTVSRMITPALTTVRKPFAKMAEEAVRLLREQMDATMYQHHRVLIPPELVIRDSVSTVNT